MSRLLTRRSPVFFGAWFAVFAVLVVAVTPAVAQTQVAEESPPAPVGEAVAGDASPAEQSQKQAETAETDEAEQATPLVGWLELSGELRAGPVPFAWVSEADAGPSLESVLRQIDTVAQDDAYTGLVVYMDQPAISFAQASALRKALLAARAAGKRVLCFAEAYDTMDYYLASAADLVLLQHKGELMLHGIAVEEMYLAGMLEKIGMRADLIQVGRFKGANETLTRRTPSAAWSKNFDALLDDLYGQIVGTLADARGMDVATFEAAMADSWTLSDTDLLHRHLVDRLVDRDLITVTEAEFGEDFAWDTQMGADEGAAMPDNPFMLFSTLFAEPQTHTHRPTIAVIHAAGPITSGESSRGDGMLGSESIGSRTLTDALADALDDDNIKGVVLRLDSPGGSALASEVIWQAVHSVRESKPIYASVGGMAASGGYYIASGASRLYVEPPTIIGSIGVVGGKFIMGGLYDWAGVSITRRSRGPNGDLFNSVEPFTEPQRAMIRESMELVYEQFRDRVRTGRGDRLPDLDAVDEGMLFTGAQAVDNGMADELGGLDDAVTALAAELDLAEGAYDIVNLPGPMSLQEYLTVVFGVRAPGAAARAGVSTASPAAARDLGPALQAVRTLLGPVAWRQATQTLSGMMLLRNEPVLLLQPSVLIVK